MRRAQARQRLGLHLVGRVSVGGDIVLAVGNPLGLTGIISATGRAVTGQAGPGSPNATLLAPSRPAHHATANCVRGFPGSCGEPAAGLAGIG
jgi:hypothetical protein